ncbi:MAG: hypothetical protein KC505_04180 [Myxococcales bacterium]|nr:hypothetical protein [Myxococcales bacterium]USN50202.1 MAG: hypothetical protein H6731_08010 [Myxococcales bacterium]
MNKLALVLVLPFVFVACGQDHEFTETKDISLEDGARIEEDIFKNVDKDPQSITKPVVPKPNLEKQKSEQRKNELKAFQEKLKEELSKLEANKIAYDWAKKHEIFFKADAESANGRKKNEILQNIGKTENFVVTLESAVSNADFPKTNADWVKLITDPSKKTHPHRQLYDEFLGDYQPGGNPDVKWDYETILKLAKDKVKRVKDILDNPYLSKVRDYATLREEFQKLLTTDKKDLAEKYKKIDERIKDIDKELRYPDISDLVFKRLMEAIK